ncbi:hypothetical protein J2S74_004745 [Evansella vedderi]|uniref:Uncharacterized protein n=1 Tax=Evansella vedderi TaxID=38282 RepID=A0ABU0A1C6_9BACI|nr:hypothetical protein [Evansella vedderi]
MSEAIAVIIIILLVISTVKVKNFIVKRYSK